MDEQQAGARPTTDAPRDTAATQAWFGQLEAVIGRLIAAHGETIAPAADDGRATPARTAATVDDAVASERALLLDLARIAAHRSERWTAPVSTYLVGVALAPHDPAVRAQVLTDLVDGLEPPTG